ncbi:MAG: DUF3179 domain-containing (seleno)protein [Acidobacteriota bacterium]
MPREGARYGRFLRFLGQGGWVLFLGLILGVVAAAVSVVPTLRHSGMSTGDGVHPETYGFTLAPALVPVSRIVGGGMPKDGLHALSAPGVWTRAQVDSAARERRSRYLVPSDRVVGVEIDGVARAYPLRVLVWHEVANDTVAGRPIVVTYNPLCDSAAVFDRKIGGETLTFGVSGLLYNSNLLMYDVRPHTRQESLWSQLLMRAVAGPAVGGGSSLRPLACTVVTWRAWCSAHPETGVVAPDPRLSSRYQQDPYANYFGSDLLRFPVSPLPPVGSLARKTPLVVIDRNGEFFAYSWPALARRAGERGRWETQLGGQTIRFIIGDHPPTVTVQALTGPQPVAIYASYFAWYAMHPHDTTWVLE